MIECLMTITNVKEQYVCICIQFKLVRWMDIPSSFSTTGKGNNFCNFLFASLETRPVPFEELLIKEIIAPHGSYFFPVREAPNEMGENFF